MSVRNSGRMLQVLDTELLKSVYIPYSEKRTMYHNFASWISAIDQRGKVALFKHLSTTSGRFQALGFEPTAR